VNISSNPNTLANSLAIEMLESLWSTQCPRVFVVPEDPSNLLNKWIEGTGCAEPCR
jgi:hypothetical protein